MARNLFGGILVLALVAGVVGTAAGQETGTPIFSAPTREFTDHEFGASLSDPGEGASVAIEGFYRFAQGPYDFGLRAGFVDFEADIGTGVLLGGNFRTQLVHYSESFPLDGAVTLGLGGVFGSDIDDAFFLPIGFSLGRTFELEGSNTTFVPFVHPAVIPVFGGAGDDDVQFAFGLGVDIKFSEKWAVRASGSLGDLEGVGISLVYLR
jgi:hypothetical protein